MANKAPFRVFLWLTRTVLGRLKIKICPKGLHIFAFFFQSLIPRPSSLTPNPSPLAPNPSPLVPNVIVRKYLRACKALYICRETSTYIESSLQIKLFMQNKAKFRKSQMNVNKVITRDYDKKTLGEGGKNKPNSNPIQTQFKANQSQNKANTNPNKANFITSQRPAIAVRCRIYARGPLFSIHERDQIYRSPRLLIDPGCPWRRGDCIRQPPPLKQASENKEHFIACWKC